MVLRAQTTNTIAIPAARGLTPEDFRPFGDVMSADHQVKDVESSAANYGTAVKIHKVSSVTNNYDSAKSGRKGVANWHIFRSTAPHHLINGNYFKKKYLAKVLERHPYSTQTFIPMGQEKNKISYLVIVARDDESSNQKLPDLRSVRAFICKGNQAVTYGPGVWHAPMVVIDEDVPHIDFAVLIHENDVSNENCQEYQLETGISIEYTLKSSKL